MKKVILFLIIIIFSCTLTSCGDSYRMDKIENVVWRSDTFNITATSEQLKKYPDNNQYNNYASIYINEKKHACFVGFSWQSTTFAVVLFDESSNTKISFYGDSSDFLRGYYDEVKKERDKEYLYSCVVRLNDSGQYYDYCVANNLEFPTTINFYGYENK
jgi:hypothetical protein